MKKEKSKGYTKPDMKGRLGHAYEVGKCNPFQSQYDDNKGLRNQPMGNLGTPPQAFDYKY